MQIPEYWKTSCDYVDEVYMNAKKASEKRIRTHSAGNGPVYMLAYGPKRIHPSAAYYSSALGAMDRTCFANSLNKQKTAVLIGAEHGQETEGIAAPTNLIFLL